MQTRKFGTLVKVPKGVIIGLHTISCQFLSCVIQSVIETAAVEVYRSSIFDCVTFVARHKTYQFDLLLMSLILYIANFGICVSGNGNI